MTTTFTDYVYDDGAQMAITGALAQGAKAGATTTLALATGLRLTIATPAPSLVAVLDNASARAVAAGRARITVADLTAALKGETMDEASRQASEEATEPTALEAYGDDLTARAKAGALDPVIGRRGELRRLVHILSRRTKNNPLLIGDPGVGKTAVVELLAQSITSDDCPAHLAGHRVIALDVGKLLAGAAARGDLEARLVAVLEAIKADGNVLVFLDECHVLMGASLDGAGQLLKPAMARGELRLIGATTVKEARSLLKDAALERRFQPLKVDEPSPDEAVAILAGLRPTYERFHGVALADDVIAAAVRMSARYVADRFLPDKAIDLIDEAAGAIRADNSWSVEARDVLKWEGEIDMRERMGDNVGAIKVKYGGLKKARERLALAGQRRREAVDVADVAAVVAAWTGVPFSAIMADARDQTATLEDDLRAVVAGQDDAVAVVAGAIRRSRTGLADPRRPLGSFLFLGPTGVGKTELARTLARVAFGNEAALTRIDMGEYREAHTAARLFGSPPGYVGYDQGGQLTEAVRRRPASVVLFDEIEKAHPDVCNALLPLFDDGHMTDGQGRVVHFKETVLIMTSNLGAAYSGHDAARVAEAVKGHFRPEFLNRVDELVMFAPLSPEAMTAIVRIYWRTIEARLSERGIAATLQPDGAAWLAHHGYEPAFGARPLKRLMQREIVDPLALMLTRETIRTVTIGTDGAGLILDGRP